MNPLGKFESDIIREEPQTKRMKIENGIDQDGSSHIETTPLNTIPTKQWLKEFQDDNNIIPLIELAELSPSNPNRWDVLGDTFTMKGLYDKAVVCYSKVTEIYKDTKILPLRKLAESYRRNGDLKSMLDNYLKATQCQPSLFFIDVDKPTRLLALAYYHSEQFQKMVDILQQSNDLGVFELAHAYFNLGQLEQGFNVYEQLLNSALEKSAMYGSKPLCEVYCQIKGSHDKITISDHANSSLKEFLSDFESFPGLLERACIKQINVEWDDALILFKQKEKENENHLKMLLQLRPDLAEWKKLRRHFEGLTGSIPDLSIKNINTNTDTEWQNITDGYKYFLEEQQFILSRQTLIYMRKRDYPKAEEAINKALDVNPFDFPTLRLQEIVRKHLIK